MHLVSTKKEIRAKRCELSAHLGIGLVPTMGNLHAGHLALVREAKKRCRRVIATVFVNPLQFGPDEDFESYPRMLEADALQLAAEGVDVLFAPSLREMYPTGRFNHVTVSVPGLTDVLCGADRRGHFDGVATVVSKLLHLVQPTTAFFGEKDWQQLQVIRKLVRDLDFPLEIQSVATQRDAQGLALSSRNDYLNDEEHCLAPLLFQCLKETRHGVLVGSASVAELEERASTKLKKAGFSPEYIAVLDEATLKPVDSANSARRVFGAARLGQTRLIDNLPVDQ